MAAKGSCHKCLLKLSDFDERSEIRQSHEESIHPFAFKSDLYLILFDSHCHGTKFDFLKNVRKQQQTQSIKPK